MDRIAYFNNCRNRPHRDLYGTDAFFDLRTTGAQARMVTDLRVGQNCVIARRVDESCIGFDWHSFLRETRMPDGTGTTHRVFLGPFLRSEVLSKEEAAIQPRYAAFFDRNGNFKRQSAMTATARDNEFGDERLLPGELDSMHRPLIEGAMCRVTVNAYERNPAARAACIAHYGVDCAICGLNFARVYGAEAAGFVHVHHVKPLSEIRKTYHVDPITDLRPVCPNCHAVIHLGRGCRSIDEVKAMLGNAATSGVTTDL